MNMCGYDCGYKLGGVEERSESMKVVKVRKIGNSLDAVLSKDVISSLGVGNGDQLFLTETRNGYQISQWLAKA